MTHLKYRSLGKHQIWNRLLALTLELTYIEGTFLSMLL